MNELEKDFFAFLDARRQKTMSEALALAADSRTDESNILKAKASIYDIFKAFWKVAEDTTDGEKEFRDVLCKKIETITTPWRNSLEKAGEHGDSYKVLIEEAKLSAVSEVKEKLAEIL